MLNIANVFVFSAVSCPVPVLDEFLHLTFSLTLASHRTQTKVYSLVT